MPEAAPRDAAVNDPPTSVSPRRDADVDIDEPIEPSMTMDGGGTPVETVDASAPFDPIQQPPPSEPAVEGPLHVDCTAIDTDTLPEGAERIGGEGWIDGLSTSGTALSWTDNAGLRHQADPTALIDTFASDADRPIHDGDEIFFALWPPMGTPALAKISLTDHEVVNLAYEPIVNITALAVDESAVYWSSDQGERDTVTLWRSDREPGETVMLGTATGVSPYFMHQSDDWLYFPIGLGSEGQDKQWFRLRKDGSGQAQPVGDPIANLRSFAGDANGLFGLITSGSGIPGLPRGDNRVVRIRLTDGSVETLFATQQAWTAALDAYYVYWIANTSFNDTTVALWRARRDGDGEAVPLVEGWTYGGGFRGVAVADAWIYFKVDCDSGGHVLRVPKPGS